VGKRSESVGNFVGDESGGGRDRRETCIYRSIAAIDAGRDETVIIVRVVSVAGLMYFIKVVMRNDIIQSRENPSRRLNSARRSVLRIRDRIEITTKEVRLDRGNGA
jgi:hypothetical protein